MKPFGAIKDSALKKLENNWGQYVGITLVYFVLLGVITAASKINPLGAILNLAIIPISWGLAIIFLKAFRGTKSSLSNLFDGFQDFSRVFLTLFLQGLYILLWTLLLVIPGIVKGISYSMTAFVLADNPELKYDAAITRSSQLMKGHKMQYFRFALSFIGWYLLAALTLGIGFLWLIPYFNTAKAAFYHELLEEEQKNNVVYLGETGKASATE